MRSCLLVALFFASISIASGQSATLTMSPSSLLAKGGFLELRAQANFTDSPTVMGWEIQLPEGWKLVRYGSGSIPQIKPSVSATGLLEWAYLTAPTSPAYFTFFVSYPDCIEKQETISSRFFSRNQDRLSKVEVAPLVMERLKGKVSPRER